MPLETVLKMVPSLQNVHNLGFIRQPSVGKNHELELNFTLETLKNVQLLISKIPKQLYLISPPLPTEQDNIPLPKEMLDFFNNLNPLQLSTLFEATIFLDNVILNRFVFHFASKHVSKLFRTSIKIPSSMALRFRFHSFIDVL